jgi:pimeloyl-ACP methyl ester carboxylesterase
MPQARVATRIVLGYADDGPREGEPLLLLAPMGRDRSLWDLQLPRFAAEFRCIRPDHRGTGESDRPPDGYSLRQLAEDALALLDELGLDRVHVAGSSMGSAVAMELALLAPGRVRSLSLYTPWARTDANLRGAFGILRALAEHSPAVEGELGVAWLVFGEPYLNENEAAVRAFAEATVAAPGYPPVHAAVGHVDAGLAHDVLDRLGTVAAPTLVVAGEADRLIPPRHAEEVRDAIPGARYHLFRGPHATHGLAVELLDEFMDTALGFLREVSAS